MDIWKLTKEMSKAPILHRLERHPSEDALIENPAVEVDVEGFYEQQIVLRLVKMVASWALCKPAMETRTLSFGRRLSFLGSPYRLAVLQNNGEIVVHDMQHHTATKVYPPRNEMVSKSHCICTIPNSRCSLGIGTDQGLVILYQEAMRRQQMKWMTRQCKEDASCIVDCIDVHPNGTHFVAAGPTAAGFCVKDLIHGYGRRISASINRVTDLRYSPCGNYIAASEVSLELKAKVADGGDVVLQYRIVDMCLSTAL